MMRYGEAGAFVLLLLASCRGIQGDCLLPSDDQFLEDFSKGLDVRISILHGLPPPRREAYLCIGRETLEMACAESLWNSSGGLDVGQKKLLVASTDFPDIQANFAARLVALYPWSTRRILMYYDENAEQFLGWVARISASADGFDPPVRSRVRLRMALEAGRLIVASGGPAERAVWCAVSGTVLSGTEVGNLREDRRGVDALLRLFEESEVKTELPVAYLGALLSRETWEQIWQSQNSNLSANLPFEFYVSAAVLSGEGTFEEGTTLDQALEEWRTLLDAWLSLQGIHALRSLELIRDGPPELSQGKIRPATGHQ